MSGHTKKNPYGDSETIDQIIEFSRRKSADCWGSNALHHGSGGKDAPQYIKAINLGRTDMHDKDAGNLFYVLRDFNFNLDILNLSNNRIGDLGVESMIYGITSLQYQTLYSAESGWKPYQSNLKTVQSVITINLSNNQIGDKGAYILADHLAKGNLPNTKFIDVSGNHISYEGNTKFAKGLQNMKQDIKILINKVLPINSVTSGVKKQSDLFFGSKEEKHAIIKDYLKHAQNNGVDIKNVTVSKDIFTSAINGGKLGINFTFGWAKCSVVPNDIKTFAADQIIATASKKAGIVNTIIGVVTCYFETFDESGASQQGIQFMNDIGLVGQGEFLENVE
ncbi:hypothetical protein Megvenef_01674 [Candidatus Megaera venefica]|uniref:Uncharacterized protein n=1 Tax=Candidatus Megaera venefica TaxID=2055910 RepID=A0ABU5NEV5_9RICK|nr:hypothetical protein [Candidatus Megaera venefica]